MGCCNGRDKDDNKSDMEIQGSPYITSSDATKSSYKESIKTCDFRQHKKNDQFFPQYDDRSSIFQNLQNICTKKDSKTIQKQHDQSHIIGKEKFERNIKKQRGCNIYLQILRNESYLKYLKRNQPKDALIR
ncbi:hypothetical protein pb186bvf_002829 [Paramecium bursaria]